MGSLFKEQVYSLISGDPRSSECCVNARARGHSDAEVGGDTSKSNL